MRWAEHVVCIREMRNAYKILVETLMGRDHSEDIGIDGKVILNRVL
jgi:hypothetical protein